MSHILYTFCSESRNANLNQSMSSSAVLESLEIGEKYETIKAKLFKERNSNREIIDDLHEVNFSNFFFQNFK